MGLRARRMMIAAATAVGLVLLNSPTIRGVAGEVKVVPRDYPTIQSALDNATAGDTILVWPGIYTENVVVSTSDVHLHGAGEGVVLDGSALNGIGILVRGTSAALPIVGVEVSHFEVRNFERGIIVQFATEAAVSNNSVHDNVDKSAPVTLGDGTGIELLTTSASDVSHNIVVRNGMGGIQLRVGSRENVVHHNRIEENGFQSATLDGVGILATGAATNDNRIEHNDITGNLGRGVMLSRPAGTAPITGNVVAHNRAHNNQRAGIAIMDAATGSLVAHNDARGNNLSGLPPCYQCNLFDRSVGGNIWFKNLGTFNGTDACAP